MMPKLSTATKVIRFLCAGVFGAFLAQSMIYFMETDNQGMFLLSIAIVGGYIPLLINTWHN